MTEALLVAYVGVGGTLTATIVTFVGTGLQQWRRNRADDRKAREQAISEILTAAVMLATSVQAYRTAWVDHSWLRTGGMRLLTIFPLGQRTPGWQGRIAEVARVGEQDKRALVADYHQVLMPKMERTVRALSDVSLWRDRRSRRIVERARNLAEVAGELVEATGAKDHRYRQKRSAFERSLEEFRAAVDR
ncbi:hypothetical protein ACGFNP_25370 [Nonomuraea sp. NPDC049269]|uniref:hypothetical protein n=1 Tax=Nonomuraea sp. NPDC049269 TaxID=3364349 RepID=UPI0037178EAE